MATEAQPDIDISPAPDSREFPAPPDRVHHDIGQPARARRALLRHPSLAPHLRRQRIWLAGVGVMIVGQALSAWGLGPLSLTVSEPLLATNLIFALLLAAPISGEIPRRTELGGAVLLCLGVGALSASRSVRALSESFGSFSHSPAAALIAAVSAALAIAVTTAHPTLRAPLTG